MQLGTEYSPAQSESNADKAGDFANKEAKQYGGEFYRTLSVSPDRTLIADT